MKILARILISLVVIALITMVAAGGALFTFARQSFPQTGGTLKLAGLSGNVEVIRDKFGVPHIYADTPADLFRAQGFVQAQDRFFQMEFWRRIGQGRISELFGASALSQDKFIRTVGWAHTAEQEATSLDPDTRVILQAYADGVNAYALPNADRLSFEFKVLGLIGRKWTPEPWTLVNTLTWGKAMSFNLAGNMDAELGRMILTERGGADLANLMLPPYPSDMPVIVRAATARTPGQTDMADKFTISPLSQSPASASPSLASASALYALNKAVQRAIGLEHDPAIGSNNWVIAGSRTATGKPILANDPHLSIQMPSIWYMNGLHCRVVSAACPYDIVGVTFPGSPGVIIGHNTRIGWGVTNAEVDTQDLFIEKPNPQNAGEFEYKGKFEPAQVREEVIRVAGAAPVTITVRTSRHGPIMNDAMPELKDRQPMALSWTALRPGLLFKAVLALDKAQNWDQFRDALRNWDTPAQNFVYADVDGNIGYQMPGNIPIRAKGDGRAPVPGWTGEYDWVDAVPFDQLPHVFNPPEGYIVTANNAVVDVKTYPYLLSTNWDYGYRAKRIEQMITSAKQKISVEDVRAMQFDSFSIFSTEVIPYLQGINVTSADNQALSEALRQIKAWDGKCTADSIGCTVFEVFWRELAHAAFDDKVGDLAKDIVGTGTHTQIALRTILADPNSKWWDNTNTPAKETRDQVIVQALKTTTAKLQTRLGNDVNGWQWSKLHTVVFPNQTLGKSGIQPIEQIFNRGPFPAAGSSGLVNATGTNAEYVVNWGPSWREVFDLSDWSHSLGIHTTGQSGHTLHQHYDDMIPLWLQGENVPLAWTRKDVDGVAEDMLTLTP